MSHSFDWQQGRRFFTMQLFGRENPVEHSLTSFHKLLTIPATHQGGTIRLKGTEGRFVSRRSEAQRCKLSDRGRCLVLLGLR